MRVLLVLVIAARCCAQHPWQTQFSDLATTHSGDILYFASPTVLRGSTQIADRVRIYKQRNGTFELSLESSPLVPLGPELRFGLPPLKYYLGEPEPSADGLTVKHKAYLPQLGPCSITCDAEPVSILFTPDGKPQVFTGNLHLARQGCMAILDHWVRGRVAPLGALERVDLCTGERSEIANTFSGYLSSRSAVASDGTAIRFGGRLILYRETPELLAIGNHSAAISDDGSTIVAENQRDLEQILQVYDVRSGQSWTVGPTAPTGTGAFQPRISSDGNVILYSDKVEGEPQLFVMQRDGSGIRQLTSVRTGIAQTVLSGDGAIAYAATNAGGIIRVDVASGEVSTLVERTPMATGILEAAAGSVVTITGSGRSPESHSFKPPLPWSGPGFDVRISEQPVPVESISNSAATFQIPWEVSPGTYQIRWEEESPSPLVYPLSIEVKETLPVAVHVLHAGSLLPVQSDDPALPGETIRLIGTGFGPVQPNVATGSAGETNSCHAPLTKWEFILIQPGSASAPAPLSVSSACMSTDSVGRYVFEMRLPRLFRGHRFPGPRSTWWSGRDRVPTPRSLVISTSDSTG